MRHSLAIVRSTRHPSGKVTSRPSPWIRSASKLGTSAIRSPFRTALMLSIASTSKPSASICSWGTTRAQKAL